MSVQFAPEAERNADFGTDLEGRLTVIFFFFFFCLHISFNFNTNDSMYMLPLLIVMHYAWRQMGSENGAS